MKNVMRKIEGDKFEVTLEGQVYTGVPCLGAYENEREALGEIFGGRTGDGQVIKGLFLDKANTTGVVFYYEGDTDITRYIFAKGSDIFEYVFEVK